MADGIIEVKNPREFLGNEIGLFEVISPTGHVFHVTCRRGARIYIRELSESTNVSGLEEGIWQIKRIGRTAT